MSDHLSALSAAFLSAEDVDPHVSLVIGSFAVLAGPAPSLDELRRLVEQRLALAPRYRQRIRRTALELRPPRWEDDPALDVRLHVRKAEVTTPGERGDVAELVGRAMAARMDRDRPLWDITLCDGLAGGRWGLLCRVHHALADGVSGTALLRVVYDVPHETAATAVGVRRVPRSRLRRAAGAAWVAGRGGSAFLPALVPVHGPSVTGLIGEGRRYAWTGVPLASVREVRRDMHVTVNDVALAAVTGGFRALLVHRGIEPHSRAIRSLVPVSAWDGALVDGPDNRVTLLLADLPVELDDPVERVRAIHDLVDRLRRDREPEAGVVAQQLLSAVPYPLVETATRLALRLPHHHLSTVTTNVPGPQQPLSCLGREVEQMLPYVPIADRIRIGVAMFSYCGELTFGITSDLDVADLDVLVEGIDAAWWSLAGSRTGGGR
ncbi:wax ester/triacylglycerol synthase family O-acyltransferase [Nocardioides zhouii]|uniref:Diacylglycerol O-acyltransferase n=1 Tax=Nocardioides zhouii TaxID=1168729 RepID=A0A4Q2T5P9_9ACTN|nr:wax ester/triacylglycerol synthase family O-acyltransferase [Nocardioides zhouii]RYC13373.1 wax ester/triacylglycerol synthase family O-acyltransferase [Nocardioides zhouii]